MNDLRKAGGHKYTSRKMVGGKWQYTYPEDAGKTEPQGPKGGQASLAFPVAAEKAPAGIRERNKVLTEQLAGLHSAYMENKAPVVGAHIPMAPHGGVRGLMTSTAVHRARNAHEAVGHALDAGQPAHAAVKDAGTQRKNALAQVKLHMLQLQDHHTSLATEHTEAARRLRVAEVAKQGGIPNTVRRLAAAHQDAAEAHHRARILAGRASESLNEKGVGTALRTSINAQGSSLSADTQGRWADHPGTQHLGMPPQKGKTGYLTAPQHGGRVSYHAAEAAHAIAAGDPAKASKHIEAATAHREAEDSHDNGRPDREEKSNQAWYASKRAPKVIAGALHKYADAGDDAIRDIDRAASKAKHAVGTTSSGKRVLDDPDIPGDVQRARQDGSDERLNASVSRHVARHQDFTAADHKDAGSLHAAKADAARAGVRTAGSDADKEAARNTHAAHRALSEAHYAAAQNWKPSNLTTKQKMGAAGIDKQSGAEKSLRGKDDLFKSFDALEKAAKPFPPKGGPGAKAMQPKGAQQADGSFNDDDNDDDDYDDQGQDPHSKQVIGYTADGEAVYGTQELLSKVEGDDDDMDGGDDDMGPPQAGPPQAGPPQAGPPQAGPPQADAPQAAAGIGAMPAGAGAGQEGTMDHHRDKALAHLQAAQAHASAAHSAKKVGEAREHGQKIQDAQAASQAAVAGTSAPGMAGQAPGQAPGQKGPMPQGGPGKPPQIAGGNKNGAPSASGDGVPGNSDSSDDDDKKKGKPFGKSEWLARYPENLRKGVDDLHKSLNTYYNRDVAGWASQFMGTPLYEDALKLLRSQMATARDHDLERKEMPTWSELDNMSKDKREKTRALQNKVLDRHRKTMAQLDIDRDALEMRLIDHKITRSARERQALDKSRREQDSLRKSGHAPAQRREKATVLAKGNMEIRIDGGDEDEMLKALEEGRTVIGAGADSIRQDGRHLLLGKRGTRLSKSGAGGTIFQGEHDAQGSRGGDLREQVARAEEFVNMREDDPAGTAGNGGLESWFRDAWSPLDPTQRVPANMGGPKTNGWQKSDPESVRILDDSTPYGRASVQRPQEHASAVRQLAQGGNRHLVTGRR